MANEEYLRHIKTHSEKSSEDNAAVDVLKMFLRSWGKINTNFASNDKWPNIDGTLEFVPNPDNVRIPEQNFFVQIKGTHYYRENKEGGISYSLQSLAFPALYCSTFTRDPGILFVVVNPDQRGEERIFWKYMSVEFVNSIDFTKNSCTVRFSAEEEIKNTEESVDIFCHKLQEIIERHAFAVRLDKRMYSRREIERIVKECNDSIEECIERFDVYNDTRDNVSKRMLKLLKDICVSALLLNALQQYGEKISIQLAWEYSLLNIKTKYLGMFYRALEYIGYRTPEQGQSERLMLKYYDFLWQIRESLQSQYGISVLANLEKFPLCINELDNEYYALVADAVESVEKKHYLVNMTRFYVHKKTAFYMGKERYYELTLQLAGVYATKFNRITVYSKENISTNYSIQIAYSDAVINLWGIDSKIKVVTDWKVSIDPVCLNRMGKILGYGTKISSKYREYDSLMRFLTKTGMNLLDLIDLKEIDFDKLIDSIYSDANTTVFKEILQELQLEYSESSGREGRNVIRYLLLNLREENIENVMPTKYDRRNLCEDLRVSSRCFPFEKNPFVSNLPNSKSSEKSRRGDIIRISGKKNLDIVFPFLKVKDATMMTGEIYFSKNDLLSEEEIEKFNASVDDWERRQGNYLKQEKESVYIESYERTTLNILNKLVLLSKHGNREQFMFNQRFIREHGEIFSDNMKKQAVEYAFVNSRVLLIYGAAGTGKTTLMNYISNLMSGYQKLFLTKTHTALKNLMRRIANSDDNADFLTVDRYCNTRNAKEYDIIFVDECSTVDNRVMEKLVDKITENTFLVLSGDIYQIEAIDFGNWFFYAKEIIKTRGANIELVNTWRTKDESLISLWNEVRERKSMITEKLAIDGPFSADIGPDLLKREAGVDEVVLCLNYDGKFGLNNMNNYFQCANKGSKAIQWGEWIYKAGDPILFNDSKRFPILHNNLKGWIVRIEKSRDIITFTIDVDISLDEEQCAYYDIEFLGYAERGTRIRFQVFRYDANVSDQEMEEMRMKSVVPFQLAYAISIHKAQGLEYDSVKVVIPKSNSEKITHGIFYTAITRAKKRLKIYWSPETMQEIISAFSNETSREKSLGIIKGKLNS